MLISVRIGYDEGGYSSSVSLESFKEDFNLVKSHWKGNATGLANRTANITSFGVLGAASGCVIALLLDSFHWGRLASWRAYAAVWASGLFIQIFSSGIYGLLLFGRIWGGLGAGALTVVTPIYLSEVTPARSRGWIVSLYMVFLLSFLSLGSSPTRGPSELSLANTSITGFFISYAASKSMPATREQYRLVQSIPLIPMGVAFICSFWLYETPRWLVTRNRTPEAREVLARLTGLSIDDPALVANFDSLHQQILANEIDRQERSTKDLFREILSRRYRGRFLLALAMQAFGQWSGGNGITYYIPTVCPLELPEWCKVTDWFFLLRRSSSMLASRVIRLHLLPLEPMGSLSSWRPPSRHSSLSTAWDEGRCSLPALLCKR